MRSVPTSEDSCPESKIAKAELFLYCGAVTVPALRGKPTTAVMRSTPPELARSALDAAPDAMIIIDQLGSILFANRQLSALFGYEHDEVIGQPIERLMPDRFRHRHVAHRDEYIKTLCVRAMGSGLDLYARRRMARSFPSRSA